jgi:hypothetical protein
LIRLKQISKLIVLVFFALSAQEEENYLLEHSNYISIIGNPKLYGADFGLLFQNHGLQNSLGVTIRKSQIKNDVSALGHFLFGKFLSESERSHFIFGPQLGIMPDMELSVGLRTDIGLTIGPGFLLGISAELMWVKKTQPVYLSLFSGWRF